MDEKKKGFVQEFKEFLTRGSVMDMAVGIIIGTAFTAIVTSLVDDIIMPLVGLALGGKDFSALSANIGDAHIMYGVFIQNIINFILIGLVVFLMVKAINKYHAKHDEPEEAEPEGPSEEVQLLTEIRDALKGQPAVSEKAPADKE